MQATLDLAEESLRSRGMMAQMAGASRAQAERSTALECCDFAVSSSGVVGTLQRSPRHGWFVGAIQVPIKVWLLLQDRAGTGVTERLISQRRLEGGDQWVAPRGNGETVQYVIKPGPVFAVDEEMQRKSLMDLIHNELLWWEHKFDELL